MLDDNIVLGQRRQAVLGVQLALGVVGRPVAPADWAVHLGAGHGADIALVALGQGAVKEMSGLRCIQLMCRRFNQS